MADEDLFTELDTMLLQSGTQRSSGGEEDLFGFLDNQLSNPEPTQQVQQKTADESSFLGELGKGIQRGTARTGATFSDAVPAQFKKLIGDDEGANEEWESYQSKLERIEKLYPLPDMSDANWLQKATLGTANIIGEGLIGSAPTYLGIGATTLAGGGVGAAVLVGSGIGLALNTSESYANLMELGDVENAQLWSLGVGALKTGLDIYPPMKLFGKQFGDAGSTVLAGKFAEKALGKTAGQRILNTAKEQFVAEGITEAMQETIDIAAENLLSEVPEGFFTKENFHRVGLAGYGGALVGSIYGGATQSAGEYFSGGFKENTREVQEGLPLDLRAELFEEEALAEIHALTDEEKIIETPKEARHMMDVLGLKDVADQISDRNIVNVANVEMNNRTKKAPPLNSVKGILGAQGLPIPTDNNIAESIQDNEDLANLAVTLTKPAPTPEVLRFQRQKGLSTPIPNDQGFYSGLSAIIETNFNNLPRLTNTDKGYDNLLTDIENYAKKFKGAAEELEWSGVMDHIRDLKNLSNEKTKKFVLGDEKGLTREGLMNLLGVHEFGFKTYVYDSKNGGLPLHKNDTVELQTNTPLKNYVEKVYIDESKYRDEYDTFTHWHWNRFPDGTKGDVPNVFAHARISEPDTTSIGKTKLLQEGQSDVHQQALAHRDEFIKSRMSGEGLNSHDLDAFFESKNDKEGFIRNSRDIDGKTGQIYDEIKDSYDKKNKEVPRDWGYKGLHKPESENEAWWEDGKSPNMPMKTTWSNFILKDLILDAAKSGTEGFSIVKGEAAAIAQSHLDDSKLKYFYETILPKKVNEVLKQLKNSGLDLNIEHIPNDSIKVNSTQKNLDISVQVKTKDGQMYWIEKVPYTFNDVNFLNFNEIELLELDDAFGILQKENIIEHLKSLGMEKDLPKIDNIKSLALSIDSKLRYDDFEVFKEEGREDYNVKIKDSSQNKFKEGEDFNTDLYKNILFKPFRTEEDAKLAIINNINKFKYTEKQGSRELPVNTWKFGKGDAEKILGKGFPYFQRYAGKYRDQLTNPAFRDTDLWDMAVENVRGINLKPSEITQDMKDLETAVRQVAGNEVTVQFMKDLREFTQENVSDPIRGLQVGNVIYISTFMNQEIDPSLDPVETALHEAWHYIFDQRTGFFSNQEREIIDKNFQEIVKYLVKTQGFEARDIQMLGRNGQEAYQEVIATAFGLYARDKRAAMNTLSGQIRQVFEKALRFLRNLGRAFKGRGFRSFEDIFDSAIEGNNRTAKNTIIDSVYDMQVMRYQRISDTLKKENRKDMIDRKWYDLIDETLVEMAQEKKDHKKSWMDFFDYGRSRFATASYQSTQDTAMSLAYNIERERQADISKYLHHFSEQGAAYNTEKNPKIKVEANKFIDFLRNTGQKLVINDNGYIEYTNDKNQLVVIKNPDIVNVISSLDAMYKAPLKVALRQIEGSIRRKFPDDKTSLGNLRRKINKEINDLTRKKSLREKDKRRLSELREARTELGLIKDGQRMLSGAYIPRYRFGPYGVVVHHKDSFNKDGSLKPDAVPLYYAHMEEGRHKGKYNKLQYEQIQKELQEFRDNPDAVTKPLDQMVFEVTHDQLFNNIPDSMVTFELLSQLISNSKDKANYTAIMQRMKDKITTKGYAKRFEESKNIPGYSRDFIRVADSYVQNSANFLANTKHRPIFTNLKTKLEQFGASKEAKRLTKNAIDYIDYVQSPEQEFEGFVKFNFLWTMGGNASSAMIQYLGLPVFTLGNLTQFSPNPLKNSAILAKNTKKIWSALDKSKAFKYRKGQVLLRFDKLQAAVDKGIISEDEMVMLGKFYKSVHSGEQFLEEAVGNTRAETRSLEGQALTASDMFANFAGIPMSMMEQITRSISFISAYDIFKNDPKALQRALESLKKDKNFQMMRKTSGNELIEDLSYYVVDRSHAVFGKRGRGKIFRGYGRIFLPFTQFVTSMNETMLLMAKSGPNGRRALATTLAGIMFFAGAMGLPAAELLKELFEELYEFFKGEGIDLELVLRDFVAEKTGSTKLAKAVTQGVPRGYTNIDIGPRLRQSVQGQDLIFAATGIRGDMSALFGVQGSVATNVMEALHNIKDGGSVSKTAGLMSPSALRNIFLALDYSQHGASTGKGNRLLTPQQIDESPEIVLLRILGFGSSKLADSREMQFWTQHLNQKYDAKMNSLRSKSQKYSTYALDAAKEGDYVKMLEYQEKNREVYRELLEFLRKNNLPYDPNAFVTSVVQKVMRNQEGIPSIRDFDKMVRREYPRLKELTVGK
jgi:hypothetical protein